MASWTPLEVGLKFKDEETGWPNTLYRVQEILGESTKTLFRFWFSEHVVAVCIGNTTQAKVTMEENEENVAILEAKIQLQTKEALKGY